MTTTDLSPAHELPLSRGARSVPDRATFEPGFHVNVQVGESLVTNPDPNATPDELLVSATGPQGEYETQYIRRSTMTPDGRPVLSAEQIALLTEVLETIQARFEVVYEAQDDDGFAMDVEFKFGAHPARPGLVVKQARPWVD